MHIETLINQYPFVVFVIGWISIAYLVPRLTGWRKLAEAYRASSPFDGKVHRFQSGYMRWGTHYGNALDVGANVRGLYVSVFFLLRMGHPSLFIPWSEITGERTAAGLFPRIRLRFLREPSIPLEITPKLAERLVRESNGAFVIK